MSKRSVRLAFETSVTWTRPPVSRQMRNESTVPKASSPRSARARSAGTSIEDVADLRAGEVGVERAGRSAARTSGSWPRARSSSQNGRGDPALPDDGVRDGRPVARSQTIVVSRWFVIPMAAISAAGRRRLAAMASRRDVELGLPDRLGVVA